MGIVPMAIAFSHRPISLLSYLRKRCYSFAPILVIIEQGQLVLVIIVFKQLDFILYTKKVGAYDKYSALSLILFP